MSARLSDLFVHRFDADLRRRGRQAFDTGRVRIVESEPGFLLAEVQTGDTDDPDGIRDVGLRWGATDGVSTACTCPASQKAKICEHLWAAILAADSTAAPDAPQASDAAPASTRRGREAEWRARVGALHGLVASSRRNPWSAVKGGARRIVYVADPRESDPHGDLHLELYAQLRLKSGAWGARRPFDVLGADVEGLEEPLDRLVLGSLRADESADPLRPAQGVRSVDLNASQRELLLAKLASSGRLYLASTTREETEPLVLDDGPPWTPTFALASEPGARAGPAENVRLEGALQRGAERLAIDEPALLFADGWLFARGAVARFDPRGALELVLELRSKGALRAPPEARAELEASLMEAPGGARIEFPHAEGDAAPRVVEGLAPRPSLRVLPPRAGESEELDCRIAFDYAGVSVDCSDARGLLKRFAGDTLAPGARPELLRRDFDAEAARLEEFLAAGGQPERDEPARRDGVVDARTLPLLVNELLARGWSVDAQGKRYRRAGAVKLAVKSGIDWFDLEGGIDFEGQVASMPALLAAARRGANVVTLGDGSVGLLPEDWLDRWGLLEVSGDAKGDRVRFKKSQGWLLDVLLAERQGIEVDAGFERWRARLESFRGIEPRAEPEGFLGELRPYQREGLGWFEFLRELGFAGCLADDMGLGKTVQVLALLQERRGTSQKPSLVVAPKSLTFNWRAEAARFTPGITVLDYSGIDRTKLARAVFEHDLVVTTYGTLRQDAAFFKDVEFDYVILDEAQAIKNPQSQVAKAARLLRAEHRLALTGTPIENHIGELWSLFEFLNPSMLGRSSVFRTLFAARNSLTLDEERRQSLSRALRPFFLRRTKDQVLKELPEKSEQVIWCDLDEKERAEYDALAAHFRATLLGAQGGELDPQTKFHALEALLRLRQAACHPGLLDKARIVEEGAKLEVLQPLLLEIVESEHKALVFSQFTSFLAILRKRLDADGLAYAYLDGSTRDREAQVTRFQTDPACKLFLISLKAGGFGLNLTAADYVFLLDPWWNPASETQAIDRAHRIGQTRNVMAYRLIARGTVEERVLELQKKKRHLADAILSEDNAVLRDLTREDLERLLA
jgi:superfamily II DNA or RNA helicase